MMISAASHLESDLEASKQRVRELTAQINEPGTIGLERLRLEAAKARIAELEGEPTPEEVEAAAKALFGEEHGKWDGLEQAHRDAYLYEARAALLAARRKR
jgi:acyl-CoA reductase-like NAD-dependent aldehyde dehydrogenase